MAQEQESIARHIDMPAAFRDAIAFRLPAILGQSARRALLREIEEAYARTHAKQGK